jgi:hypothetical protein
MDDLGRLIVEGKDRQVTHEDPTIRSERDPGRHGMLGRQIGHARDLASRSDLQHLPLVALHDPEGALVGHGQQLPHFAVGVVVARRRLGDRVGPHPG